MFADIAFGDIGVYRHWCLETLVFANIGLCRGSLLADCVVYVGESLPRGGGELHLDVSAET